MSPVITAARLHVVAPLAPMNQIASWADALDQARDVGAISTAARIEQFVANVACETGGFTQLRESFHYTDPKHLAAVFPSEIHGFADAEALIAKGQEAIANRVYAGRFGNGDEASGDGWRYRGGGAIELTFRANYRSTGVLAGINLEANPELIEDIPTACRVAAIWWQRRGCNAPADQGDTGAVRRLVNGPALAGLDTVQIYLTRWRKSEPPVPPAAALKAA